MLLTPEEWTAPFCAVNVKEVNTVEGGVLLLVPVGVHLLLYLDGEEVSYGLMQV